MKRASATLRRRPFWRVLLIGGMLPILGQCGLSDQQITAIFQSVITTGLNALVSQGIASALSQAANNANNNTTP